ncbi:hypothetical protein MMC34_004046 [Xylographa carneopallida]|nr:hypothetical protein [Xylographa carneopallida]
MATETIFYYTGVATASYAALLASNALYSFLRPSSLPKHQHGPKASWALITGASDGIGYGFAEELCARGFNVILHGRNKQKLEKCAAKLTQDFPSRENRLFIADASIGSIPSDELLKLISDIQLTVLINNVGGTHPLSAPFKNLEEHTLEEIEKVINLNAGFTTQITKILLPTLIRNGPSLVLNIGSMAYLAGPWISVYAGTKGYLLSYSNALQTELQADGKDVTVHAVLVGAVSTNGLKAETSLFVPSARVEAQAILDNVGCGSVQITPYFPHAIQKFFLTNAPQTIVRTFMVRTIRALKNGSISDVKKVE